MSYFFLSMSGVFTFRSMCRCLVSCLCVRCLGSLFWSSTAPNPNIRVEAEAPDKADKARVEAELGEEVNVEGESAEEGRVKFGDLNVKNKLKKKINLFF